MSTTLSVERNPVQKAQAKHMDKLLIEGGRPLEGSIRISGAKNSALPAMTAALLTSERVELDNIPRVRDIITMGRLLAHMSAIVETPELPPTAMVIQAGEINGAEAPYELVRTMRASILTLGPLVARTGTARVSLPGGCSIGARPVDLHLKALEQMGAEIATSHGYVEARVPGGGRLRGGRVVFDKITVTGTENILMAAALAEGDTYIENAALEPEITDLAELLIKMGADIKGAGTSSIRVRGKQRLHGAKHTIIPDRIEAGTFLVAGAITKGALELTGCAPEHLTSVMAKLRETGVEIRETGPGTLCVHGAKKLIAADVRTEEYPGFATDMQAQFMALATQAEGTSVITETIFENRFLHASEMMRMGANISIEGRNAVVHGPSRLSGTGVIASDLRASASLVLAALVAQGETIIDRVYHIDRGYERIEEKLSSVGARIRRIQ
jgi:UDP-N-acetylglucosamine 1-carboxyvinyltransferase